MTAAVPPSLAEIVAMPVGVADREANVSVPVVPAMAPPEIATVVSASLKVARSNVPPEIVRAPGTALLAPRARVPAETVVPPA